MLHIKQNYLVSDGFSLFWVSTGKNKWYIWITWLGHTCLMWNPRKFQKCLHIQTKMMSMMAVSFTGVWVVNSWCNTFNQSSIQKKQFRIGSFLHYQWNQNYHDACDDNKDGQSLYNCNGYIDGGYTTQHCAGWSHYFHLLMTYIL